MECLVLYYIESVPPQPIWIVPAPLTFKIHATFASNVIHSSIFRLSYIMLFFFAQCHIIVSLVFFVFSL